MANLSAEELLFLSNLMHMREEWEFADIWTEENERKKKTIGGMLESIDKNTLERLRATDSEKVYDGEISGAEWARMLEEIKDNKDICDLKLVDLERDDKNALSVCLEAPDGQQYVVFRGTAGGEWPDNFEGGYMADTAQQLRALAFVERQSGEHITVVGHSKGGNKAKYVAICSDKVNECYSFDGQGFSTAFWQKYGPLIEKNKDKIHCFALDYDFVNILLPDIFSDKWYVNGHGVDAFAQNHSPNSFFNGEWEFDTVNQSEAMESLHMFINYIINTGDTQEVTSLMNYLGNIVNFLMGKQPPDYTKPYPKEEFRKYLLDPDNADELGMLIAYIVQYERGGNKITITIFDILWNMDGDEEEQKKLKKWALFLAFVDKEVGLEVAIAKMEYYGDWLAALLLEFGVLESKEEAVAVLWALRIAGEKQQEIPLPDRNNCKDLTVSCIKRDFSDEMRTTLLGLVEEVEDEAAWEFWKWDAWYRIEDWCGRLNVEGYKDNIEGYHRKVIDINDTTKTQMQNIFDAIDSLDERYGQLFQTKAEEFAGIAKEVKNIMAS